MKRDKIKFVDPELAQYMYAEEQRQRNTIELIASENIVSHAVMAAAGSCLTNKYAEGYPGKRYYGGCANVDKIEQLAIDRARQLFGAEHANVQPHCGTTANLATYAALCNPGDTILAMSLDAGGHLSHGYKITMSGKLYNFVHYGVDDTGYIDYDQVRELALQHHPKLIVAGASAYPRIIDFEKFREIADEVGALLMVDMAHIAGLVAGGVHPSPVPYADVVTTTTHKTLRGPRGGMILCKEKYAKAIDRAVFPANQGGPLEHIIAAKAIMLKEAMSDDFAAYTRQVVSNAAAMARTFELSNIKMVSGGTDNHLILLDLRDKGISGKELETLLDKAHITVNKNAVYDDPLPPSQTSGIRIGTPAVTTRGMDRIAMIQIATDIVDIIRNREEAIDRVAKHVESLCDKFPIEQF